MINIDRNEQITKLISLVDEIDENYSESFIISNSAIINLVNQYKPNKNIIKYLGEGLIKSIDCYITSSELHLDEFSEVKSSLYELKRFINFDFLSELSEHYWSARQKKENEENVARLRKMTKIQDVINSATFSLTNKVLMEFSEYQKEEYGLRSYKNARTALKAWIRLLTKQGIIEVVGQEYFESQENKLFELLENLEQEVSVRFKPTKGKLYISALPEDVVTASFNTFNWDSCFNPTNGENALAPYMYLRKGDIMITYFVPEGNEDFTHEGSTFTNKLWRRYIMVDDKTDLLAVLPSYPSQSNELDKMFIEMLQRTTDLKVSKNKMPYYETPAYIDTFDFKLVNSDYEEDDNNYRYNFGGPVPSVFGVGYIEEDTHSLSSPEEDGFVKCYECECYRDGDYVYDFITSDDYHTHVCEDCVDDYGIVEVETGGDLLYTYKSNTECAIQNGDFVYLLKEDTEPVSLLKVKTEYEDEEYTGKIPVLDDELSVAELEMLLDSSYEILHLLKNTSNQNLPYRFRYSDTKIEFIMEELEEEGGN